MIGLHVARYWPVGDGLGTRQNGIHILMISNLAISFPLVVATESVH